MHNACFHKHEAQTHPIVKFVPLEELPSESLEGDTLTLPRRASSSISNLVSNLAKSLSQTDVSVLLAYLLHCRPGQEVIRRISAAYRESVQPTLAENVRYLFRVLPSHSPLRSPLVSILARDLPRDEAINLTAASSAYISRAIRAPPSDSSPLFDRYPHGVHRDKVKDVERKATVDLLTQHALIKRDSAKRVSYLHYEGCAEFYDLYRTHMADVVSSILALVEGGLVDSDDDISCFMRRNIEAIQIYSTIFASLQDSLPFLPPGPLAVISSFLSPTLHCRSRGFVEMLKHKAKIHHAHKSFLGCQCKACIPACQLSVFVLRLSHKQKVSGCVRGHALCSYVCMADDVLERFRNAVRCPRW